MCWPPVRADPYPSQHPTNGLQSTAALVLSLRADQYFPIVEQAMAQNDKKTATKAGKCGIELLLEVDRLLESHSLNRLDRWVRFARSHDGNKKEKDAYEANAKQIITVWGPPVNDYSCRVWSGLIRDFYVPRMQQVIAARINGTTFNRHPWEAKWVNSRGMSQIKPFNNPAQSAAKLVRAAYAEKLPHIQSNEKGVIATWSPSDVKTTWTTVDYPFSAEKLKSLKGVRFVFSDGSHRLDIQSAAIIADGQHISMAKNRYKSIFSLVCAHLE